MERDRVLDFLDPNEDIEFVRRFVEHKYAELSYTLEERLRWTRNPADNPYRATVARGEVHCGHNPWLRARIVDNLQLSSVLDKLLGTWEERN